LKHRTYISLLVLGAIALLSPSCKMVSSFIHDDTVVAKVGDHKLYLSELSDYIPNGIPPEDSTKLALQYINSWAEDMVYMDVAESELSKSEKDVSKELEDYRRSLLKFRYEQQYINQRLDTTITDKQVDEYYNSHQGNFVLEYPIMQVLFMSASEDNPDLELVRKTLSKRKLDDIFVVDTLLTSSAMRYVDYGGQWVSAVTLALEFGTDYVSMLSKNKDNFIEQKDGKGGVAMARIYRMIPAGRIGPKEYYVERIKDAILSARKQSLLNELEMDLMERAKREENFEIY